MLSVPVWQVEEWLEGHGTPPCDVFLAAIDIIEAHGQQQSAGGAGAGTAEHAEHP